MYGICGDVYDRLDYETHSKYKTMRYFINMGIKHIKHNDRNYMHVKWTFICFITKITI